MIHRDWKLTFRMMISFLVLALIYIAFLGFIATYFGLGILPISVIAGLMIGAQWFFSDKLVLWSTRTRLVTKQEAPELHQIVERLVAKANLPKPKIGIMQSDIPNAFATGKGPKSSVIVVSSGLMKILNQDELEAVLSHELTHIRHHDMTVITLVSLFSTIAWFLMQSSMFSSIWGGYGYGGSGYGGRQQGGGMFLVLIVAAIVWFLSFLVIRAISRYREYAADRGGALMTEKPMNLSSALEKIGGKIRAAPPQQVQRFGAMNALFIMPVISGKTIAGLFSTHPPIEERIKRLKEIQNELQGSN